MAPNAPNVCCLEFYTKSAEPGGGVKRLPAGVASRGEEGPGRALLPGRRAILCWGLTWSQGASLCTWGLDSGKLWSRQDALPRATLSCPQVRGQRPPGLRACGWWAEAEVREGGRQQRRTWERAKRGVLAIDPAPWALETCTLRPRLSLLLLRAGEAARGLGRTGIPACRGPGRCQGRRRAQGGGQWAPDTCPPPSGRASPPPPAPP